MVLLGIIGGRACGKRTVLSILTELGFQHLPRGEQKRIREPTVDYVLIVESYQHYKQLAKNHSFRLVRVFSGIKTRIARSKLSPAEFQILQHEEEAKGDLIKLGRLCKATVKNNDTVQQLRLELEVYLARLRDELQNYQHHYFMSLAGLQRQHSNCMKTSIGAIVVAAGKVISCGWNGTTAPLTRCNQGGCKRCNSGVAQGVGLEGCECLHAEQMAILNAGKQFLKGASIYTTMFPCFSCAKLIAKSGLSRIFYEQIYAGVGGKFQDQKGLQILQQARVEICHAECRKLI